MSEEHPTEGVIVTLAYTCINCGSTDLITQNLRALIIHGKTRIPKKECKHCGSKDGFYLSPNDCTVKIEPPKASQFALKTEEGQP